MVENKIKTVITVTRHLVVPAIFVFLTEDRRCCEALKNQLIKRRNIFPTTYLKFKTKAYIENFRFTK